MFEHKDKVGFQNFWTIWRKHLTLLVGGANGKLLCPVKDEISFHAIENGYVASPQWPICFRAIPHKGNSSGAHKLAVFINGSFRFERVGDEPEARLIEIHSNVAFFKIRPKPQGGFVLTLADAYHFDHFVEDPVTSAPHPVFHAQRNIRPDEVLAQFRSTLNSDPLNNMEVEDIQQAQKDALFGLKSFRLPTPQLDLFSLSAIIAADHLVEKCSHDSSTYKSFKDFLKLLKANKPSLTNVRHKRDVSADAARADNRFIWQWYSPH